MHVQLNEVYALADKVHSLRAAFRSTTDGASQAGQQGHMPVWPGVRSSELHTTVQHTNVQQEVLQEASWGSSVDTDARANPITAAPTDVLAQLKMLTGARVPTGTTTGMRQAPADVAPRLLKRYAACRSRNVTESKAPTCPWLRPDSWMPRCCRPTFEPESSAHFTQRLPVFKHSKPAATQRTLRRPAAASEGMRHQQQPKAGGYRNAPELQLTPLLRAQDPTVSMSDDTVPVYDNISMFGWQARCTTLLDESAAASSSSLQVGHESSGIHAMLTGGGMLQYREGEQLGGGSAGASGSTAGSTRGAAATKRRRAAASTQRVYSLDDVDVHYPAVTLLRPRAPAMVMGPARSASLAQAADNRWGIRG